MVSQQLLDYIKQQSSLGKGKEELTQSLLKNGWQLPDIEQAFATIANPSAVPTPVGGNLPKARQILNEAWEIYKNRFKTLILIRLVPLLATLGFGLIFGVGFIGTSKISSQNLNLGLGGLAVMLVALIILIYISLWSTVAQLMAIKNQAEDIGFKEAFQRSQGMIGIFFATGLLVGLAVLGGFILLIVPGIIFCLWFSQTPYIVMEENLANTSALKRSKYYIKGRMSEVFGKFFYIGIITLGLTILFGLIPFLGNVFSLFWTPLVTVYCYQLYRHLKATRP